MLNRNFWFLWSNRVLTRLAYHITTFALLIWVFKLTESNIAVSLWVVIHFVASVLLALVAGVAVDIFDRRKIMIWANLIWGVAALGFIWSENSLPLILVFTFIIQGMDEFFIPSQNSALPQIVKKGKNLLKANSYFYLAGYAASFVGYILGGAVLRFFGYKWIFVLASALAFLGAFLTLPLPSLKVGGFFRNHRKFGEIIKERLADQWRFLADNPHVTSTLILVAVTVSGGTGAAALAPGFAEQVLGIDARDLSFIAVIPLALGLTLGSLILSRWGRIWEVWQSVLAFSVVLILLATSPVTRVFFVNHISIPQTFESVPFYSLFIAGFIFILGLAASTVAIPIVTSLQRITPGEHLGRTFGSGGILSAVFTTVFSLTFGAIADIFTPAIPFVLIGVGGVAASVWIRRSVVIK